MINGNLENKVKQPLSEVTGILVGQNLLEVIKSEMLTESVFQKMFGVDGEHIFINSYPNINETITPSILLSWKNDRPESLNAYLMGDIEMSIILPTQLKGDYNALRSVGALFQRWMMSNRTVLNKVLGLLELGVESTFDYTGLAVFSGNYCPVIKATLPFKFDMQKLIQAGAYDPDEPLDSQFTDDILLEYDLMFCNPETQASLLNTGDKIEQV